MSEKSLLIRARKRLFPGYEERRARRKQERRVAHFDSGRWEHGDGFSRRSYASYDEYVAHQSAKLDRSLTRRQQKEDAAAQVFRARFEGCAPLAGRRNVLCLGARLGGEVRALRALGHFAVGLDLNPGPDNPYVFYGDFHDLKFSDQSVDAVYCNALDHVFDLEKVVAEVDRILVAGGIFIGDAVEGVDEGFTPGAYEATAWRRLDDLIQRIRAVAGWTLLECRDLGGTGRDHWHQFVLEKGRPSASSA